MKIVVVHNYYQVPGGEDVVLKNEIDLLKRFGNTVLVYTVDNKSISGIRGKACSALSSPFSFFQYFRFKRFISKHKPDVVHVHNYFPLLSPSIFHACRSINVTVVHTLHNYRAVCPTGLLMHGGKICEKSVGKSCWWAVSEKVYRNSIVGSIFLVFLIELNKKLGTWSNSVDGYIALTSFSKDIYTRAGWPSNKIFVKPNFTPDFFRDHDLTFEGRGYALYVGRLSEEKGIDTLIEAWRNIDFPLKVIGDGPLKSKFDSITLNNIEFLGYRSQKEVLEIIKDADFLLIPSIWYETFGMVVIEAFMCGTPVIASNLGSLKKMISFGHTGLHFEAGNSADLEDKVRWMISNPEKVKEMSVQARNEYLKKYTPEDNYKYLMQIYHDSSKIGG